ncbi:MAG TPA: TauD/TfdA family dioxygenase [Candidatus Dormibacteraeota bacterium]|nr:TauD/TfdA family dioxygenase [Candidatus Dormibacteraeota bacterium]
MLTRSPSLVLPVDASAGGEAAIAGRRPGGKVLCAVRETAAPGQDVTDQPVRIRRLTPRIGADISGLDLSRPLSDEQFRAVQDALMEHQVIFFRDQRLTHEQHKALGRRFGDLHVHPASTDHPDGHPEVMVIHADATSRWVAGEHWHSDVSCEEAPPMGSILYLQEVPPVGGDTLFASMYTAYEALSEPIRHLLEPLTAVHDGGHYYEGRYGASGRSRDYPRAEHPVVCAHPVTGRRVLFVNRTFTTHIPALTPTESHAILEMLFRHIEKPEFQCRLRWEPGSVAFWDNRCVQHQAIWDYYPHRRHGYRVTIQGTRPTR